MDAREMEIQILRERIARLESEIFDTLHLIEMSGVNPLEPFMVRWDAAERRLFFSQEKPL